ncbi:MAG: phage tail tape measure protein [Hyphomicrobiaceae bacterium]
MATGTKIDDLYVAAGVDTKTLDAGLREFERKTQTSMQKAAGSFKAVDDSVGKLERNLFSLRNLAIAGVVVGIGSMVARALNAADAIQDMSEAAGLSVERFQELRFAADRSGVSQDQFAAATQRLARVVGEASQGKKEQVEALARLGVSYTDAAGNMRPMDDILNDVIRSLGRYDSQAEAAAAASKVLGEEAGSKMAAFARQGEEAIEGLTQRARDLGIVMSEEMIADAAEARKELETLGAVVDAQLTTAFASLSKEIAGAARFLAEFIASAKRLKDEGLPPPFGIPEGQAGDMVRRMYDPLAWKRQQDAQRRAQTTNMELGSIIPFVPGSAAEAAGTGLPILRPSPERPDSVVKAAEKLASDIAKRQKELNDAWAEDIEDMRREIDADFQRVIEQRIGDRPEMERRKADARAAYEQGMDELRQKQIELENEHLRKVQDAWGAAFDNIGADIIRVLSDSSMKGSDKMKAILLNALYQIGTAFAQTLAGGQSPGQSLGGIVGTAIAGWLGVGSSGGGATTGGGGVGFGASPLPKFASGGVPPVGRISWVGEKGPEPFIPAVSGRILSHEDAMRAVGAANGNGRGGDTYIIDARGADAAALARVERLIERLNGSIEPRVRGVMSEEFRRNRGVARQAR